MKNSIIALALANILFLVGCRTQSNVKEPSPTNASQASITKSENVVTEISIDSVNGLTSDEAIKLCRNIVGEKDDENFMFQLAEVHTNRDIGYRCDGAIECNGKQYYIVCMLWSDDEESYWSTIGFLGVSADGSEISEILKHSDNTYSFGKLLWNTVQ